MVSYSYKIYILEFQKIRFGIKKTNGPLKQNWQNCRYFYNKVINLNLTDRNYTTEKKKKPAHRKILSDYHDQIPRLSDFSKEIFLNRGDKQIKTCNLCLEKLQFFS